MQMIWEIMSQTRGTVLKEHETKSGKPTSHIVCFTCIPSRTQLGVCSGTIRGVCAGQTPKLGTPLRAHGHPGASEVNPPGFRNRLPPFGGLAGELLAFSMSLSLLHKGELDTGLFGLYNF
jgi:hypothetical protein